jgi:hypothetical protein
MRLVAILALCVLVALAAVTAAGAKVKITKIYYNSPGRDNGSDDSLNGEWVMIKNISTNPRSIRNWTLRDAQGHVYTFPGITMPPGSRWKIHTGPGLDSFPPPGKPGQLYWGMDTYVWNNGKDRATLRKANRVLVDRCYYNNPSRSYKIC